MSQRRSIIIKGKTTSISMEEVFWKELDRLAMAKNIAWQDFLREILLQGDIEPANRAAYVKGVLLQYVKFEDTTTASGGMTTWWDVVLPGSNRLVETFGYRVIVGRTNECELPVDDEEVSRCHCLLAWDNHNWWLIDLQSKNGVFVNDNRVDVARLRTNQFFTLGKSKVRMLRHS